MTSARAMRPSAILLLVLMGARCGPVDTEPDTDAGSDADTDADSDADSDRDSDSDSEPDTDSDSDTDSDTEADSDSDTDTDTDSDTAGAEDCDTPGDEDGNGLADCEDSACASHAACQGEWSCDNAADDDGDLLVDCADDDCWGNGCAAIVARVTGGSLDLAMDQRTNSGSCATLDGAPMFAFSQRRGELTLAGSATGTVRVFPVSGDPTTCDWSVTSLTAATTWAGSAGQAGFAPVARAGVLVDTACGVGTTFLPTALRRRADGRFSARFAGALTVTGWYAPSDPSPYFEAYSDVSSYTLSYPSYAPPYRCSYFRANTDIDGVYRSLGGDAVRVGP